MGSAHQIRNEFKAKPHKISTGDGKTFMFYVGSKRNCISSQKKKVQQEWLESCATFGLRNCGAELIPGGWDAVLEKSCWEPALLLDSWPMPETESLSELVYLGIAGLTKNTPELFTSNGNYLRSVVYMHVIFFPDLPPLSFRCCQNRILCLQCFNAGY